MTDRIQTGTHYRAASWAPDTIDEESRTVEIAFSSEEPVDRFFGVEILDHNPESVRLGRLADGGPILVDHDGRDHVGVVERASIDADGKGRALARFGSSPRAVEVFRDIVDGIRRHVSVGYRVVSMLLEEKGDSGPDVYRVTEWEPLEISMVSVPADATVGVGRTFDTSIIRKEIEPMDENTVTLDVDVDEVRLEAGQEAQQVERDRVREITAIAAAHRGSDEIRAMADKAIDSGAPLSEFQRNVIAHLANTDVDLQSGTPASEIGLTDKEVKRYSLMRVIDAIAEFKTNGTPIQRTAPFELECSLAVADSIGRSEDKIHGMLVPFDVQQRTAWSTRAAPMDTSENTHLVGTDHLAGSFIEALRNRSVTMRLGVMSLPGLVGNVSIPAQTSTASWSWLAEDGSVTAGELTTGSVSLSPKTMSGAISLTRRLVKQSSPAAEGMIRNDLVRGAAVELDAKIINGSGASNQPTGILATSGIATSTIATAGQPTHAEIVEFGEDLETGNALEGTLAFLTTPAVKTHCKTTLKTSGVAGYIWETGNRLDDYQAISTNQMPTNGILFGNFEDVVVGFWGVLDLSVDPYTDAAKGGLVVRAFQDADVGVRHAASFCKNA